MTNALGYIIWRPDLWVSKGYRCQLLGLWEFIINAIGLGHRVEALHCNICLEVQGFGSIPHLGHRVDGVQALVGVGLEGRVVVGRHLPAAEVDRLETCGLDYNEYKEVSL